MKPIRTIVQSMFLLIASAVAAFPQAAASPSTLPPSQPQPLSLTLHDAEKMALRNHPRVTIAELNALAAHERTREARAAFFPTIVVNGTGVTTEEDGNRFTAGALNNPTVFDRAAAGATASQLITDFGRTSNLAKAADLGAQAREQSALATREQIIYAVDQAFYNTLSAEGLVKVAEETVAARQVLVDQVQALEQAKLRSALDLSFANVALAQAQLLLVNAGNNRDAAYATLSEALGLPNQQLFNLVDESQQTTAPGDIDGLIQQALTARPDVKALELDQSSAQHFYTAERRLKLPVVSALGAAGLTPVKSDRLGNNGYGAVGANVQIPIFNGFQFSARAAEAKYRAQLAIQETREYKDAVARQVRTAWLDASSAQQREKVAAQLLDQATLSFNLAQERYKIGLGSIVELSQAQLQKTEAEINSVSARYQYEAAQAALEYQTGTNIR